MIDYLKSLFHIVKYLFALLAAVYIFVTLLLLFASIICKHC